MAALKIFSWNILGPETRDVSWFADRYHQVTNWPHRFEHIIKTVIYYSPDVVALQEVDLKRKEEITKALAHYGFTLSSYGAKGTHGGAILFHKTERLSLIHYGHVKINVLGLESHKQSACAWATFTDNQTKQSIFITSAHFQPQNIKAQFNDFVDAISPMSKTIPIIIIGDFNTKYKTMIDDVLPHVRHMHLSNFGIHMFEHESWTHQSTPKHDNIGGWASLDHCLYTDNLTLNQEHSFVGNKFKTYASDLVYPTIPNTLQPSLRPIPSDHNVSDHLPLIVSFLFSQY